LDLTHPEELEGWCQRVTVARGRKMATPLWVSDHVCTGLACDFQG
jgi:hypothetical protein